VIEITKLLDGYLAHATPPHVKTEWRSISPMAAGSLFQELKRLGAHQTDVGDAFYLADPDWLKSSS
jgi:hypothetical protein